jgi:hypothetical protein
MPFEDCLGRSGDKDSHANPRHLVGPALKFAGS